MKRLILTNTAAGAGNLKKAGVGDMTIGVSMFGAQIGLARYSIAGPLPTKAETAMFFGPQQSREPLFWQSIRGPIHAAVTTDWLMGLSEFCRAFDVVECWFDPDVDGQLNLVHLLDFVRQDPETAAKLLLVHSETRLGPTAPADAAAMSPVKMRLNKDHLAAAQQFWNAYRHPTPQPFAGLLADDFSALPYLAKTMPRLLAELPSVSTGLSATEMHLLTVIGRPEMTWHTVFQALWREQGPPVFSYGYDVDVLERLGAGPNAAVFGVTPDPTRNPGNFNQESFSAHRQSKLSLTEFGQAVAEGREDFLQHHPIHRWWGNTELTDRNLWRWDGDKQELLQSV